MADPVARAPTALRPYLRFRRLTPKALSAARGVLDGDAGFRERVTGAVSEDQVGTPAWRWLTRPEGWEADWQRAADEVTSAEAAAQEASDIRRLERELEASREAVRRADERARQADASASRAAEAMEQDREARTKSEAELDAVRSEAERLRTERAAAVRSLKELERIHMATRAELRQEVDRRKAAEAAQAAMAERSAAAGAPGAPDGSDGSLGPRSGRSTGTTETTRGSPDAALAAGTRADAGEPPQSAAVVREDIGPSFAHIAEGVRRAAEAARDLAAALAETASALGGPGGDPDGWAAGVAPDGDGPRAGGASPPDRPAVFGRHGGPRPPRRRPVPVPPPLLDESPAAASHLLRLPGAYVLVDGYNVSMTAWGSVPVAEQRDRLVDLLDELEARTGVSPVVVFDGVSGGAPAAPVGRSVRVRFTDEGVEADDVLIAMVDEVPADRPVVVVSSDGRVREGAQRRGANVVGAAQFLAAAGRS
jgi:predicted RNA-binding protein with PIN domain